MRFGKAKLSILQFFRHTYVVFLFWCSAEANMAIFSAEQNLALVYPDGTVFWAPKTSLQFRTNATDHPVEYTGELFFGKTDTPHSSWTFRNQYENTVKRINRPSHVHTELLICVM